jgi:hypothetical protein
MDTATDHEQGKGFELRFVVNNFYIFSFKSKQLRVYASLISRQLQRQFCVSEPLKGQSHEKVGELRIWGVSLSPN